MLTYLGISDFLFDFTLSNTLVRSAAESFNSSTIISSSFRNSFTLVSFYVDKRFALCSSFSSFCAGIYRSKKIAARSRCCTPLSDWQHSWHDLCFAHHLVPRPDEKETGACSIEGPSEFSPPPSTKDQGMGTGDRCLHPPFH